MPCAQADPDRKPVAAENPQRSANLGGSEVRLRGHVRVCVEEHDQIAPAERKREDQRQPYAVLIENASERRDHR